MFAEWDLKKNYKGDKAVNVGFNAPENVEKIEKDDRVGKVLVGLLSFYLFEFKADS